MTRLTRRAALRSILGIVLLPLKQLEEVTSAQGASLSVEQLRPRPKDPALFHQKTFYRTDASVLLFSIPIHKRRGVGGACAEVDQCGDGVRDTLSIRFSAGSYPEQARGINRLGYIEEVVASRAGRTEELAYFGFMTSSPEEGLAEARRAMEESGRTVATYSAAEGHLHSGIETSRLSKLNLTSTRTWMQTQPLLEEVRTAFLDDRNAEIKTRKRDGSPATFLFSLLSAAWGSAATFEAQYTYLGKDYRIKVTKKSDAETGRRFASEGLTESPESVVSLKGTIRELGKHKALDFKFWTEGAGRPELPIRFEYKARSFLRLSFERDPAQAPAATKAMDGLSTREIRPNRL